MKKILYHFRISLLLGFVVSVCACQFNSVLSFTTDATKNSPTQDSQAREVSTETPTTGQDALNPPEEPNDKFQFASDLIIKAINPGYTIDGTQNVGEFIELQKLTDNHDFSLAGYGLRYTNSSGKSTLLLDFSEGSLMTGETLLMRFARSPDSDRADATYMTTLAMTNGRVDLIYHEEAVDGVCWGSGESCLTNFKSAKPTTLLRNASTGIFEHVADYEPAFDSTRPSLVLPPTPEAPPGSDNSSDSTSEVSTHCYNLEFSEILAYYATDKSEQFVEFYNPSDQIINLSQCSLRYKNKAYALSGAVSPDSYYAYYPAQQSVSFSFTKNPNSSNTLELVDTNGAVIDTLVYNHGQKKSTSYAKFYTDKSEEVWDSTYATTPGSANVYQEFRNCPTGKTINPDTGNCINITSGSGATTCPEGKYLNPLTGRCKKIEDDSNTPKPCAEGYERNPETNRCRKIKSANDGANYALVPNTSSSKSVFIAAGAVALVALLGGTYIILQFRREIARTARVAIQRINNIRKNLVARRIGFHRKKKP